MSKFVDILEGINRSPPGVLGLAGVFDADLAIKIKQIIQLVVNNKSAYVYSEIKSSNSTAWQG